MSFDQIYFRQVLNGTANRPLLNYIRLNKNRILHIEDLLCDLMLIDNWSFNPKNQPFM